MVILFHAELPSYASPIKDKEMKKSFDYLMIRYGRLVDQPLTILNEGPQNEGFTVCTECGAAIPGENMIELQKKDQPYRHPRIRSKCQHPSDRIVTAFLGYQFLTDMILVEIELDSNQINTTHEGLWIESAAQSLSEATT